MSNLLKMITNAGNWLKTFLFVWMIILLSISKVQAAENSPLQTLNIILDWLPSPEQAPLFVAEQQGFYQQQGLKVNFITPADPGQSPKMIAANKADLALDYQPRVLLSMAQGLSIKEVGVLVNAPLNCLMVLNSSGIHNLRDLKGKRIAYSTGSIDPLIIQTMLASQGLSLKDVTLVNVGYNLMQSLLTKNVDAVIGLLRTINPTELELLKTPGTAFYPEQYGFLAYDELVFITNQKNVNDPRIKKFLVALKQGINYLNQHPEQSWQKFATQHVTLNNQLNHMVWFNMLPYFNKTPEAIDKTRCKRLAAYLSQKTDLKIPVTACE